MKNYVVYHLHEDTSNCNGYADSCTNYKDYIKLAKKQNMKAIAFSNHGGIYDWIKKKQDCDKAGIKYIHGVELYVCTKLEEDERGYHIGLYAKNYEGVLELNSLMSKATSKGIREDKTDRHMYYNPRISFEELLNTSDNILVTTACLASMLWKKRDDEDEYVKKLLKWMSANKHRCFLEIQYHTHNDQIEYNKSLYKWSQEYRVSLIAGTDTHSLNSYKAECRKILQKSKNSYYGDEDAFDLMWKSYDELVKCFQEQNALPQEVYLEAIENTNRFADMVEEFQLDKTFKYPNLYGQDAIANWKKSMNKKFNQKVKDDIIDKDKKSQYKQRILEEFDAMEKQGMESFMLFMSELVDYCNAENIPYGFCRGSVGGSVIAFITDIIDVDPIRWNTVFSRFCNADRISLADIDMDFSPEDRKKVYDFIINKFTPQKTAYIAQFGTLKDRGTIDTLARGLDYEDLSVVKDIKNQFEDMFDKYSKIIQEEVNLDELEDTDAKSIDFDYSEVYKKQIRNPSAIKRIDELKGKFEQLKRDNRDIFYYFEGIKGTIISKGQHPAGIIGSPITLADNLGVFYKGGDENIPVSQCAMKAVDSINFVKFDILGLKTIGVLKDTYNFINSHYQKSHEINWNDKNVWEDMIKSSVGLFQFEGDYAFKLLNDFIPQYIDDMSLVNASLRPSGKSYRDRLIKREFNKNPSKEIDALLKHNNGFLVYQEDTIKFLTDICGFSGSLADTTRRAIGKKDIKLLNEQLPKILDGYCNKSNQPREIAEEEVKQFLEIIDNSSEYQFGYNHSTGYSMIGYACARMRNYYPLEFVTAYLNRAEKEEDISAGVKLAHERGIEINPIQFRYSKDTYWFDKENNSVYKGISSIKGFGEKGCIGEELYKLRDNQYNSFIELLEDIEINTTVGLAKVEILIKLGFFSEFGLDKKLLDFFNLYKSINNKKQIKIEKAKEMGICKFIEECSRATEKTYMDVDGKKLLLLIWNNLDDEDFNIKEKIGFELDYLGYIQLTMPTASLDYAIVTDIDSKYKNPILTLYRLKTGEIEKIKIKKKEFNSNPFKKMDCIKTVEKRQEKKWKMIDGKFIQIDELEDILSKYTIVEF